MRPLYKTQFQLEPGGGHDPQTVGDEVMRSVAKWVESHYERGGATAPTPTDVAEITRSRDQPYQVKDSRLNGGAYHRAVYWSHPANDSDTYFWCTLCDLAYAESRIDFQFVLGVEADDYDGVPAGLRAGRPRLIPDLLGNPHWRCLSGSAELPLTAGVLTVHEVEAFVEDVLYAGERMVPVVLMGPMPNGGYRQRHPLPPKTLADRLAGTAKVMVVRDDLALGVLNQYLGANLAVDQDSLRVFAPGLAPDDEPSRHWYFLGESIRRKGLTPTAFADFLFARLAERAVVAVSDPPALAAFRRLAREQQARTLQRLEESRVQDERVVGELLEEAQQQIDHLTAENAALEEQIREREDQIRALQHQLDVAQSNVAELSRQLGTGEVEHAAPTPTAQELRSVSEIVRAADRRCRHLEFLPSAFESADDVPANYFFPERVEALLVAIEEGAAARAAGDGALGTGWKKFFQPKGFEYKPRISDTCRTRWKKDYEFLYEGKRQLFEEHFTISARDANKCLSVHISTRLRPDKIVVAYVGRHLTNTQS